MMTNLELIQYIHQDMNWTYRDDDRYTCHAFILTNWKTHKDPLIQKLCSDDTDYLDGSVLSDRGFQEQRFFNQCQQFIDEEKEDVYFSINSCYRPKRLTDNIRHLNCFALDYDFYKIKEYKNLTPEEMYKEHIEPSLPFTPTAVINSGRGLYVLYCFHHASTVMMNLYRAIYNEFYKQQKKYGMDAKAMLPTQVIRIPGSINSRTGNPVSIIETHETDYTIQELASILPYSREEARTFRCKKFEASINVPQKPKEKKSGNKVVNMIFDDFMKLIELRDGQMNGCRESMLNLIQEKVWFYGGTEAQRIALSLRLNSRFSQPMTEMQVKKQCKPSQIFEYTTGKKKMMEKLEITEEEASQLSYFRDAKTIRSDYNRRRRNARKNAWNRSDKQQAMHDRRTWIVEQIVKEVPYSQILEEYQSVWNKSEDTFKRDLIYIVTHQKQWKILQSSLMNRFIQTSKNILATLSDLISTETNKISDSLSNQILAVPNI